MAQRQAQGEGSAAHERLAELVAQLRQASGVVESLPTEERDMAARALEGATVSEIASAHAISEAAVWSALVNAARFASGQVTASAGEIGGLGSDFGAGDDEAEEETSAPRRSQPTHVPTRT